MLAKLAHPLFGSIHCGNLIVMDLSPEKISRDYFEKSGQPEPTHIKEVDVTIDKYASILYPLLQSCFPAEFQKAWNRTNISTEKTEKEDRLNSPM